MSAHVHEVLDGAQLDLVTPGSAVVSSHPAGYALAECSTQEGRHLAAGDVVGGAEPIVGGRVAFLGDTCGGEFVDVRLEDGVIVVDE